VVPTSSSDPDRPIAGRVLRAQMGVGAVLSLACFAIWGRSGFVSALIGAGIAVIANAYRTFKALQPASTARRALGKLYLAELVNFGLTIALFLVAGRLPHVQWLALLLTYVGTIVALWWVPLMASTRQG
jgi:F0F1-type ATP synthase assembly protein I